MLRIIDWLHTICQIDFYCCQVQARMSEIQEDYYGVARVTEVSWLGKQKHYKLCRFCDKNEWLARGLDSDKI